MPKITSKASLVLGTNLKYHLVDFQGVDIQIDQTNTQILSSTTDFTASTEAAGIVKRPVEIGDVLTLNHTGLSINEGVEITVDTVAANLITYTVASGTPSDEAAGSDINITGFKKTFQFLAAGGLSFVDGVEGIVFASKTVDDWDAGDLDIYPRIFTSIEPRAKSIAALNGWEPHDISTLKALRDSALEIRPDANTTATRKYSLLRSDPLHEATDQMNFWADSDAVMTAPQSAVMTGYINELVLIEDTVNAIDERGTWHFRCLEHGKTHLQGTLNLQHAEIYTVASNNDIDPKLANPGTGTPLVADGTISGGGIYANILLNVDVDSLYANLVDGISRDFVGFLDQDTQNNQTLHTKAHYLLRQPTDINNDGTGPQIRGDKTAPITSFSGDLLTVDKYYPLNFYQEERNSLQVIDNTETVRSWQKVYILTIAGPAVAVGGTFSLMHRATFGASSPVYLQDETPTDQKDIPIQASVAITINFSSYAVDGHTPGQPIPLALAWNKPGSDGIEPDHNLDIVMTAANQTVTITPTANPSYTAA